VEFQVSSGQHDKESKFLCTCVSNLEIRLSLVFQRNTLWVEKSYGVKWRSVGTHCALIEMTIAQNVPMER
jgi:hypothetical protein